mmetsp:Transcript_21445/g.49105  ORF Transcript_21445/g.49105 Transcript_21445/m.49105 type:complete len:240 (-) Transcript_21445:45-764(-)|eukprot:562236-Amphidinium_carterae.1
MTCVQYRVHMDPIYGVQLRGHYVSRQYMFGAKTWQLRTVQNMRTNATHILPFILNSAGPSYKHIYMTDEAVRAVVADLNRSVWETVHGENLAYWPVLSGPLLDCSAGDSWGASLKDVPESTPPQRKVSMNLIGGELAKALFRLQACTGRYSDNDLKRRQKYRLACNSDTAHDFSHDFGFNRLALQRRMHKEVMGMLSAPKWVWNNATLPIPCHMYVTTSKPEWCQEPTMARIWNSTPPL